uniref:CFA20 domain-containing protein n=1 Tax=Cuerna arida TaxID=1464854 RepID=A0A1B6FQH4_9HEMI
MSGSVKQVKDEDLKRTVLQLTGTNVATAYITSPPPPHNCLGLRLPWITLHLKYFNQPFSFEVQILDDEDMRRRFRFSTYHKETKLSTFLTTMPLKLIPGWNIVQLNLAEFTQRAYRTMYMETLKIQVHANCRLLKVFFSDRMYADADLPSGYKLEMGQIRHIVEKPTRTPLSDRTPKRKE